MPNLIKIFFLLIFSFIATTSFSQNSRSLEKRKQELIDKEEQRKQEENQAIKEMQATHLAIQSKDTRKRMKKSKKKANKNNKNKNSFSFKKYFKK